MIYFFYGIDIEKRAQACAPIASIFNSAVEMNDVSWNREKFENLAKSNSLFESKQLIILENILDNPEIKDFVIEHLDDLKNSENVFVFLEKKALKDTVSKFSKYVQEVKEFVPSRAQGLKGSPEKANVFAITYPLEKKDKKNTWLELQKLKKTDTAPEALSGILFWKIKDMILKNHYRNWSGQELKNLSSKLVSLHHDAHRGLIDFQTGLEKFIIDSI